MFRFHFSKSTLPYLLSALCLLPLLTGCNNGSSSGGSGSGGNSGSGNSGLTLAATYTRPGTSVSVKIYNDSNINVQYTQSQISDIEMLLSAIPTSMLKDINWIVPSSPSGTSDKPSTGQGLVSSTTNGKIDCPDLLGQAGDNIYANNELVGTQAEWQQLLGTSVSSSDAGSYFGSWFESWIENSSQDMDEFENNYLGFDDASGGERILFIMAQFFNPDHTLNVFNTGPDIITNGWYAGSSWTSMQITPMQITRTATGFTLPAMPAYPSGSYPITLNFDPTGQAIASYTRNGYTSPLATPIPIPAPFLSQLDAIPLSQTAPTSANTAAPQVSGALAEPAIDNSPTQIVGGGQPLRVTSSLAPDASYIPLDTPAGARALQQVQALVTDSRHQPLSEQDCILSPAHSVTQGNIIVPSGR